MVRLFGIGENEITPTGAQQHGGIRGDGAQNARRDGVQIQLRKGLAWFDVEVVTTERQGLRFGDNDIREHGGAAAGVPLADAVPVVFLHHTRAVGGHDRGEQSLAGYLGG